MTSALNRDERQLARVLFANRLLKASGEAFQQLFWAVMRANHPEDFIEIRPQGRKGDGGNDGYRPSNGHYFQVYGPLDPAEKVQAAAKKLGNDFEKLTKSWNSANPIRSYSFVFNDKYEGIFPDIAKALEEIGKAHSDVACRPFTAGNLEDSFMNIPAEKMDGIIGLLPDPARVLKVDFGIMRDVIAHIMNSPASAFPTRFGDLPDLAEKIRLNNLCSAWGDSIRSGARQSGHVDKYFSKNSTFMKQLLRDHLVEIYKVARDHGRELSFLPEGISREDISFDDFRRSLLPEAATRAAQDAVEIIIGYYFEACDVFDPHADRSSPNASA